MADFSVVRRKIGNYVSSRWIASIEVWKTHFSG
jgi:hypothetical protein